jgi:hypothetical protein
MNLDIEQYLGGKTSKDQKCAASGRETALRMALLTRRQTAAEQATETVI